MTVEQSSLQQHNSKRIRDDGLSVTYAKIREVTGIDDQCVIDEAISACCTKEGKFKLEDVVDMLVQDDTIHRRQLRTPKMTKVPVTVQEKQEPLAKKIPTQVSQLAKNPVIDLTQETGERNDIDKAINASLQDSQGILGGQVTREEQDISRILEASLAESKAGTKRKRGEVWFVDPLNPHERRRQEGWPVGLKNVGNTCWFSAVIQSLFYLPKFRRMVLHFKCPLILNLRFMQELRLLFGLMIGSTRKYVDPSKAVDILKEAFSSPSGVTDSQQDVSEFQHKLLEWLEDAFKADHVNPSSGEPGNLATAALTNPVTELFYGQFRAEGVHEGKVFTKQETFGQFPLQVNGFRDIHESLEATTMQDEIEAVNKDASSLKSGQELWFTRLPPVLTFELSRFQFNQQLGRPEKIHNKIEFPRVIYVDRYLENNKSITRQRRERSRILKEELSQVQSKLDRFMNYGSGSKRCPLHDILQYALEFAESKPPTSNSTCLSSSDVDMESPKQSISSSNKSLSGTTSSLASTESSDQSMCYVDAAPSPPSGDLSEPHTPQKDSPLQCQTEGQTEVFPAPRHVNDNELRVLRDCLRRWRTEVENDVRELQSTISTLECQLSQMYSDDAMQKFPYHLHAVLVHEGQAASGHYWAFIYDEERSMWLKFNDITISESSWAELERESVGGYHNASAYCLMYVDKSRIQDVSGEGQACRQVDSMETMPKDLQEMVVADNKAFAQEIEDWDAEQVKKSTGDPEVTIVAEHKPTQSAATQTMPISSQSSLPSCHAQLSFEDTVKAVYKALDTPHPTPPEAAFTRAAGFELKRLQESAKMLPRRLPKDDARLQHIVIYLCLNQADSNTQNIILLEQFSHLAILDQNLRAKAIRATSIDMINKMRRECGEKIKADYEQWHQRYHQFRQAAFMFVRGLQAYYKERFTEALPYFNQAWLHNMSAMSGKTALAGINTLLISYFRRKCLEHVNEEAMQQFEMDADVSDALTLMCNQILPSLAFLSQSGLDLDMKALEELRGKWCAFLEKELSQPKVEKLQDFLTKMFENWSEIKLERPQSVRLNSMMDLYKQYCDVINKAFDAGDIEKALTPS
ncbi:hypothetical protein C0Q70_12475 [Pomacea canaliculata]|uniref:USP domain-containing protein n=1 Tax=Pomacea canaliculata TaxID=400727 RepID=A0A2T7P1M1_POMCA|nr:hypothetical protein C0Q70_12475 [Pomacea canaliculata]